MVAKVAPKKPRVGARVDFDMGNYVAHGLLIEDRGPLGSKGERIWRVEVDEDGDIARFEIVETQIRRVR